MGQDISRRTALRAGVGVGSAAAGAAALAACGGGTSSPGLYGETAASTPTAAGTGGGSATGATGTAVPKADVPVGGGRIVGAAVVTQPAAGTYKAFTSVCTHRGCTVSDVTDGKIHCACHGSLFDASTGAVVGGPATAPLAAKTVTESGPNLLVS